MNFYTCNYCGSKNSIVSNSMDESSAQCQICQKYVIPREKQEYVQTQTLKTFPNSPIKLEFSNDCQEHFKPNVLYCDDCLIELCPRCFDLHKMKYQNHDIMSIELYNEVQHDATNEFIEYITIVGLKVTELDMIISEGQKIKKSILDNMYKQCPAYNESHKLRNYKILADIFDFDNFFLMQLTNSKSKSQDLRKFVQNNSIWPKGKIEMRYILKDLRSWLMKEFSKEVKSIIDRIQFQYLHFDTGNIEIKIAKDGDPDLTLTSLYKHKVELCQTELFEYRTYDPKYKIKLLDFNQLTKEEKSIILWSIELFNGGTKPRLQLTIEDDISFLYPRACDITHLMIEINQNTKSDSNFQLNFSGFFLHLSELKYLQLKVDSPNFKEFIEYFAGNSKFLRKLENFQLKLPHKSYDNDFISKILLTMSEYLKLKKFEFEANICDERTISALNVIILKMKEIKGLSLTNSKIQNLCPKNFEKLIFTPLTKFSKTIELNLQIKFCVTKSLVCKIAEAVKSNPIQFFQIEFNLPYQDNKDKQIFEPLWSAFENLQTIQTFRLKALKSFKKLHKIDYNLGRLLKILSLKPIKALQLSLLNYECGDYFLNYDAINVLANSISLFLDLKIFWIYMDQENVENHLEPILLFISCSKILEFAELHLHVDEKSLTKVLKIIAEIRFSSTDVSFIFENMSELEGNRFVTNLYPHLSTEILSSSQVCIKSKKL